MHRKCAYKDLANLAPFLQGYLTPARFLQDLARVRKVDINVQGSCKILQLAGYVTSYLYFPITDKIQALNY